MKKIAIVIPAYNELENIESLIKAILKNASDFTIFLVDDSKDESIGSLINLKNLEVKYFHRKNERGRGSAVLYGLKKALKEEKYDIFIEMDADFSHDPQELNRHIKNFENLELDLLIASRYLKSSKIINWSIQRKILSKLSNFLARILLGINLKDFTNGFRCYYKKAAK